MRKNKLILILILVLAFYLLYIFLVFPKAAPSYKKQDIVVTTSKWNKTKQDSLGFYYLERKNKPDVETVLKNCQDSVSIIDITKKSYNTLILKKSQNKKLHLTNNYTKCALSCYSNYLASENKEFLKIFWAHVDWMVINVEYPLDSVAVWKNKDVTFKKYNLDFGWASAFAQGYGLSVLSRAYQDSGDEKYLNLAEKVLNSFDLHYKKGGVMDIDADGNYWYLEFPAEPPAYVLNGMIYALFGIYDYYIITDSPKAHRYFERAIETLAKNLDKYDLGYWSAYDLYYHDCASYHYHRYVHIPQLMSLYDITQRKVFRDYAGRFRKYLNEPWLTIFKTRFSIEAIIRRIRYKNPIM